MELGNGRREAIAPGSAWSFVQLWPHHTARDGPYPVVQKPVTRQVATDCKGVAEIISLDTRSGRDESSLGVLCSAQAIPPDTREGDPNVGKKQQLAVCGSYGAFVHCPGSSGPDPKVADQ